MKLDARISRLENGITVATSRIPEVQSVAMGLWVSVGGRHESARLCGASHFIEHMLFKGTQKRSAQRISRDVERRGGYLNAFTQAESTCFYGRVAAEHLGPVFGILADMYTRARISPRDVENEKSVVIEELMMGRDQPDHHVHDLLDEQLWPQHPLGRNLSGTEQTVRSFQPDGLHRFKDRFYTGKNTTVTFAGAVDHESCVELARKHLGSLSAGRRPPSRPVGIIPVTPRIRIERRRIEQVQLALGFRVFGRHDPRRWALSLVNTILGGNMSSRLFHQIRERRGWAYSINSSLQFFSDTGLFHVGAGLDAAHAGQAVSVILDQIRRIRERTVPASELRAARDYVTGQMRIALEGSSSRMMWLGENLLGYGAIHQPEDAIEKIRQVTAEDLRDVAAACLRKETLAVSILAPEGPDTLMPFLSRHEMLRPDGGPDG